jgi:hypothetical protein
VLHRDDIQKKVKLTHYLSDVSLVVDNFLKRFGKLYDCNYLRNNALFEMAVVVLQRQRVSNRFAVFVLAKKTGKHSRHHWR